jgi:SEC-C motif/gag-polyprotein putative aspartyl protease
LIKHKVVDYKAFTLKATGRMNAIVSEVGISLPNIPNESQNLILKTNALWDTGATNSVITKSLAKSMNLVAIDKVHVQHAGGISEVNVFLISIYLPNQIEIPAIRVSECEDNAGHFGIIIGMDIISFGDFAISNFNNSTVFTFRIPSVQEIDFVIDHQDYQKKNLLNKAASPFSQKPIIKEETLGRNDPCHCGSEKKFKNCHGK